MERRASSPVQVSCGAGTPDRVRAAKPQSGRARMPAPHIPAVTTAPAALPAATEA
jgi:hypothetical protein